MEAVRLFADKQVAHDYFVALRFPNGVACPRLGCGSANVAAIKGRNAWRCRECNRQFTAKVGTIFEDSPIGFDKWLPALWMLTSCRKGISSYEISRALKVTQKTAWFMLHRLRYALKAETFDRLAGEVEADETYIGGRVQRQNVGRRVMHRKKGADSDGKTTVMGMIERGGGRVPAFAIPDTKSATLLPKIDQHIEPGSTVYTDAL
ncbi:MAG TPA: IS1595 family transposase, partial [Xanthomonadales bacterium]|nr:IS1595 family transposase [Xanthomonadales bacterium]